jgi:uncharacterized RDD family membrane protein YckC
MQNNNAGFTVRLFATLTDSFIEVLLFVLGLYLFVSLLSVENFVISTLNLVTFLLFFGILRLFYSIYFITHFGGSLGKLIFNLKIVDNQTEELLSNKRAFYRVFIGYAFSAQFIFWGFLRIIKNPSKFAWHDELFNTKVVSKGSVFSGVMTFFGVILLTGFLAYKIFTTFQFSEYYKYAMELFQPVTTQEEIMQKIGDDIDSGNDTIGEY